MLKLFQFNVSLNVGSTGRIAEQIGELAQSEGWESYIIHGPRYVGATALEARSSESSIEEKMHWLKSIICDGHGLGTICGTKEVVKFLEEVKPDIIHLHNIHGYYVNYPILFNYFSKIKTPIVWTLHDCWPFTGHCTYFDRIGCEKWKTGCFKCPQKKEYPTSITDCSNRNYNLKKQYFTALGNRLTLIPVSRWLDNLIKQSFLKDIKTNIIHNGIDISTFKPLRKNDLLAAFPMLQDKKIVLGVAQQWTKRKGLDDFYLIREKLPYDYVVVLVGLSQEQIKTLPDGIVGIERTNSKNDLAILYSLSEVFLNLSYEDNYPTVILEAISCGTPVITYNTGGCHEAISESTGYVVGKKDINGVINAIESISNIGKEKYVESCRSFALEHFDQKHCFEEYIKLYKQIIGADKN